MNQVSLWILIALAVLMSFSMARVLWGPTAFDRLTGLGLIGTKAIIVLLLLGYLTNQVPFFVDISLSYSSIAYIGSLALAKYFEKYEESS